MKDELLTALVTVATAIIGVAILAVLVSKNANTSGVVASFGSALAQDLAAATAPVTGGGGISNYGFTGGGVGTSLPY